MFPHGDAPFVFMEVRMYSPKIDEALIPALYHTARARRVPMTRLVAQLLRKALKAEALPEAALETLRTHLFAPDAFDVPNEIYNYLQQQRRGFDFFGGTEDPKIHSRALNMQRIVLAHLLHSTVLRRMTDSRLYGNEYPVAEYMDDLTDAIFEDDATTNVNTFRQHLQVEYVDRLASIIDDEEGVFYDYIARSAALRSLQSIQDLLDTRPAGNAETQAHTAHLQRLIDNALD